MGRYRRLVGRQGQGLLGDADNAERIMQLMARASGWRASDRPNRILVDVNRIYPAVHQYNLPGAGCVYPEVIGTNDQ